MTSPSLLKHRAFMRFWIGQMAASFAFQMLLVGMGWQIYNLTDSALSLGLVGLARYAPQLFLTLYAGHVADNHDRQAIMLISRALMTLSIAVLAITSMLGSITAEIIYGCCIAMGISRAFEMPATQAMVPNIVGQALLAKAMTWTASGREATTIIGPAIGGIIYIWGAGALYTSSVLCSLLSAVILFKLDYRREQRPRQPVTLDSLLGGLRFTWRNPVIFGSISLDMFAVLIGSVTSLLPIIARDVLETGPWGLGVLRSSIAVGAMLMSIYLAWRPVGNRVGIKMFISVAIFGAMTILFGVSQTLWLSVLALMVMGAADMVSVVIRSTLVQLETPDEMRGRVSAVNSFFISTSNQLGEFESGVLAAWVGAVPAILIGGVGTLGIVALWGYWFPTLLRRDRLESDPESK
ncbi:MFS general substrate transporter [Marinobacterium lacunae]|uniref:MFS general substrate transporter n=1 Tax=Marinobacterium lacunae TaxID=1232683 RepID=A0A081G023_9GAMM|nr:MFS transporter [Marinobacterium lacunae]KEA64128.1 MFS general substrate transporter [Marinobacterium lacunae]